MAALGILYDTEASPGTETDPLVAQNTFKILDEVPVYPLVLAVREDITQSIDTTCTYEQLKSPQTHQYHSPELSPEWVQRCSYGVGSLCDLCWDG